MELEILDAKFMEHIDIFLVKFSPTCYQLFIFDKEINTYFATYQERDKQTCEIYMTLIDDEPYMSGYAGFRMTCEAGMDLKEYNGYIPCSYKFTGNFTANSFFFTDRHRLLIEAFNKYTIMCQSDPVCK